MNRFLIFLIVTIAPSAAFSQTKAEFSVRGWAGDRVLVERNERGQREVDGAFVDYAFSMLEVYDDKTRKVTERFKLEKPIGNPGEEFKRARAIDKSPAVTETAKKGVSSPTGNYLVVSVARAEQTQTKSKKNVCVVEERLQLLSKSSKKVTVLFQGKSEGAATSKRVGECPKTTTDVFWSDDEKRAVILRSRGSTLDVRPVDLTDLTKFADAPFVPFRTSLVTDGRLKESTTWSRVLHGDYRKVEADIEKSKLFMDKIAVALLMAIDPDRKKRARGFVAKAVKKEKKKTSWHYAMRAAIYRATGDTKRAQRDLGKILKKNLSYEELIELADFFYAVDLDIASQLYVHALSTEKALKDDFDSKYGYSMLLRALLDSGNMQSAKEVLDRFEEYEGPLALQAARYETLRRTENAPNVVADALFDNPGLCDAYLYAGRALGQKNSKKALHYFKAATICDESLAEAIFLLADLEERRGDRAKANTLYSRYRRTALPRQNDDIRAARRQHAYNRTVGPKKDKKKKK